MFISVTKDFPLEAKRLRINGANGAGKTNILKYFELLNDQARGVGHIKKIHPVYVFAPGESYFDVHEQIVDKLAATFLGELLEKLRSDQSLFEELDSIGELLNGIEAITNTRTTSLLPEQ